MADKPEMSLEDYEKLMPLMEKDGLKYYVPNQHCAWRVESLYTKEPDTIEWIDSMKEGEVLWDIGANIGLYTLRAAKRSVNVVAFEPEAQNYAILTRNIFINHLQDKAIAYPIAVAGETKFDLLHLSSSTPGGSCHTFGQETDFRLDERVTRLSQGCYGMCIADIIAEPDNRYGGTPPNHIKIDVDGIEHEIVSRGVGGWFWEKVTSCLVELNTNLEVHNDVIELMENRGFKTTIHPKAIRTEGAFKGVGNHIFRRG